MPLELADALCGTLDLRGDEQSYAVIDAARDPDFAAWVRTHLNLPAQRLFRGEVAQYMDEVAPWLVPFDLDGPLGPEWTRRWGNSVGILITSRAEPGEMLQHLRRIFIVTDSDGQDYFLRFYDPRITGVYVDALTRQDRRAFLGPIRRLVFETPADPAPYRAITPPATRRKRKAGS